MAYCTCEIAALRACGTTLAIANGTDNDTPIRRATWAQADNINYILDDVIIDSTVIGNQ